MVGIDVVLDYFFLREQREGFIFKVRPFFKIVDILTAFTYLFMSSLNIFLVVLFPDVGDIVFECSLFLLESINHFGYLFYVRLKYTFLVFFERPSVKDVLSYDREEFSCQVVNI